MGSVAVTTQDLLAVSHMKGIKAMKVTVESLIASQRKHKASFAHIFSAVSPRTPASDSPARPNAELHEA